MSRKSLILIASMAIAVSGCADQTLVNAKRSVANQPPTYQEGYVDGCSSGYRAALNPYFQFRKNALRFDSDSMYKQGWGDGYGVCKGNYDTITRL